MKPSALEFYLSRAREEELANNGVDAVDYCGIKRRNQVHWNSF